VSRICHVVELVVSCIYNVVQLVVLNMSCGSASCFACINVYIYHAGCIVRMSRLAERCRQV
jgi:hypothetical protein